MARSTRRRFITAGVGAATIGSIAGCSSTTSESGDGESTTNTADGTSEPPENNLSAQASFFVFGEFADAVAGDVAAAETLVPIGQHGHGWEPGPDIQGQILDSDLFIYGTDGFQPWADDLITSLRDDNADVEMIATGNAVDLIAGGHDHGSDHNEGEAGHEGEEDHDDHGHEEEGHDDHEDEDDHDHEGEKESHDDHEGEDDHGHEQEEEGHDDHEGEDEHGHEEEEKSHDDHEGEDDHGHQEESHDDHEGEDEDGHDHGAMDPHFWMDPQRASEAVTTLETTFAEMDGDNAETYADNAAAYRDQLAELDRDIQSTVDDAPKSTLFVAGHDAFQYLEDRYGVRVESLTGLSPDDQPTPQDIERAQDIIDEYGLAHVCADPLEDQTAAEQLVAETDATEVLPLTAIPGQTQAWADEDWGYIDVMENVNLDTLETALNA